MLTKPYECWDDRLCDSDSAQVQNAATPEMAVVEFGCQFQIEDDRDVWVRDPDDAQAEPKKYHLRASLVREYWAEAEEA